MNDQVVTTGALAKELGVSTAAIHKWALAEWITPEFTTPGGHYRWNAENVREQLRRRRRRDDDQIQEPG